MILTVLSQISRKPGRHDCTGECDYQVSFLHTSFGRFDFSIDATVCLSRTLMLHTKVRTTITV
jgi:hypothetical protein